MDCPKCGKEMESGWIYGGRSRVPQSRILWSPKQGKSSRLLGEEDVELSRGGAPAACICRDCRTVVLEYSETSPYDKLYQEP